jgi:hypothetical protein
MSKDKTSKTERKRDFVETHITGGEHFEATISSPKGKVTGSGRTSREAEKRAHEKDKK